MIGLAWALDIALVAAVLWSAARCLLARDLFQGIVFFIAFGSLMAVAWVRLAAPDLALAEAAIGAGITGALLMGALARAEQRPPGAASPARRSSAAMTRALAAAAALAVTGVVGWAVLGASGSGLEDLVMARLPESGVGNPVTAVLLNFRAYDTLLEVGVLLLAAVAVVMLGVHDVTPPRVPTGPVLVALVRLLVPLMVVVAGYLLWRGADAPGGAFQAGAVLGAAGVLYLVAGGRLPGPTAEGRMRLLLVLGVLVFLAVAGLVALPGGALLEYPEGWDGPLILVIEAAAAVSIGLTLVVLFEGGLSRAPGGEAPGKGAP